MEQDKTVDRGNYVVKDSAQGNFTIISNRVINDTNLSWEARGLLVYLLSKPKGWQVRKFDIIRQSPAGETVVRRVLAELRDWGYLRYELCSRKDTEFTGLKEWRTTIHDKPLPGDPDPERRQWRYFSKGERTCGNPTRGDSTCGDATRGDSTRIVNTELVKTEIANTEEETSPRLFEVEPTQESKNKSSGKKKKEDKVVYSDTFLAAYELYPRKEGKKAAAKAWNARVNQGASEEKMLEGTRNYAAHCKRERTERKFIKMAQTFYGPDEWFLDWQEKQHDPNDRKHNVVDHKDDTDGTGGRRVSVKDLL